MSIIYLRAYKNIYGDVDNANQENAIKARIIQATLPQHTTADRYDTTYIFIPLPRLTGPPRNRLRQEQGTFPLGTSTAIINCHCQMSRAKNWCFTLNNYTDEELRAVRKLGESFENDGRGYLVFGFETAPSTGVKHLQGYISFPERKRPSQIKTFLRRAHLEIAKGNPKQNQEYCKKGGNSEEFGSIPAGAGARTDLTHLQERIKSGASRHDIRDEFFTLYCRYPKAIDNYIQELAAPRTWETNVVVYWGKTGTGKTRSVFAFTDIESIYVHPGDHWFDGYVSQPVALFDDFNGSEFKLSYLLKLLDRYPMKVPVKGGFVNWIPKHIYITSNKDPHEWYQNAHEEQRNALFRRIKEIKHFNNYYLADWQLDYFQ